MDVDHDDIPLLFDPDTDAEDELEMKIYKNRNPLSPDHLALHLPKCKGCSGCDKGTSFKSHSRRRKRPKVSVSLPDSLARPFGAMAHLDTIAMEPNSEASQAARFSVNVHDEKTSFCMAFPSHNMDAESVMDAMHRFDDDVPVIRRWWTDAAPEFGTAAGRIRSLRPLAHYKSARALSTSSQWARRTI